MMLRSAGTLGDAGMHWGNLHVGVAACEKWVRAGLARSRETRKSR
jgi:hypothetical protein